MEKYKTLKIGAHTYKLLKTSHGDDLGQCDTTKHTITIMEGIPETQHFTTLLHEAMHAMNSIIDHALLDSLSEQISQFLLDNDLIKLK